MHTSTLRRLRWPAVALGLAAVALTAAQPASASPGAPSITVGGYTTAEVRGHDLHILTVSGTGFSPSFSVAFRVRAAAGTSSADRSGAVYWSTSAVPCGVDLTVEATDTASGAVATGSFNIDCAPIFP